jgi:DNA-binding NtrC family response regulator/tetratricopeptide (TPR) repeat protein
VASIYGACLANLGASLYGTGDFESALEHIERAGTALPAGEKMHAALEVVAKVLLSQSRLDECSEVLARINASIRCPEDRVLYSYRHIELTRAHLIARLSSPNQALAQIDVVLNLAAQAGDAFLSLLAMLTQAELLQRIGRMPEAVTILGTALGGMPGQSPELYAQSERVLACGLIADGDASAAEAHYARAHRIYAALKNVPGELELQRCWSEAAANRASPVAATGSSEAACTRLEPNRSVLHSAAALVLYPNRPELVARELVELLGTTQCVHAASVRSRAPDGTEITLSQVGAIASEAGTPARRLAVGFANDQAIEIVVHPKTDTESIASVNAVAVLLSAVLDLERARVEREERATLWPVEELSDGEHAVIAGQMREQMYLARKIARTNVNVLITGESGTGKEILARAIHDFSDRATKPFVPFNCAAIPRDLLESQLFGHRRGAFTGADRDHAGVIRNARDGTLFLDEIGEMSLDLQPKLLRFLESGEIAPLGEPSLIVNVRIVAATNSNLEDAVRAGKFREDLFYRLNVVRLSLKPLRERRDEIPGLVHHFAARAAREFKKGNIRIAEETMERLLLYRWPGNVRQLQNELRRMMALAEPDSTLGPEAISEQILGGLPLMRAGANAREIAVSLDDKLLPTLARVEAEMIKAALAQHHGRVDAVAKALGISRKGLYLKRQRLGL